MWQSHVSLEFMHSAYLSEFGSLYSENILLFQKWKIIIITIKYIIMKVFTMVKGEVDIVADWVLYHGDMFGYNNLYVIDNFSRDGTWETLLNLRRKYNINIMRLPDYKKKGEYMTLLLRIVGKGEIVFPIDIDEFIVKYNRQSNSISCDKNLITNYIKSLPRLEFYKMNYIQAKNFTPQGCERATVDVKYGAYSDYKGHAKTFFNSQIFRGIIDHGNHYLSNSYLLTSLCLVHFHQRNLGQIRKKVYNNVNGLGHNPFNLQLLKQMQSQGEAIAGYHHINKQIKILENQFNLDVDSKEFTDISLVPLNEKIINLSS